MKWVILSSYDSQNVPKWDAWHKCSIALYTATHIELPGTVGLLSNQAIRDDMFLGEYTHTIDDKGRITIPAKFRGELAVGLVVTRGFDQNLMVLPQQEWDTLAAKIAERPLGDESVRAFRRRVFSGAVDLNPDRQGRIIVPQYLRDFAGIDSEVVIAGMFNYVELWSAEAWRTVRESIEDNNDARRWEDLGV